MLPPAQSSQPPSKERLTLNSSCSIGRLPDNDIVLDHTRVSRRHAIITWRKGNPYAEDLGSGFGTRLNGEMLLIGQAVPLKPGDHIWLGGCILAYDVEI